MSKKGAKKRVKKLKSAQHMEEAKSDNESTKFPRL
jgi:hypothetical protein